MEAHLFGRLIPALEARRILLQEVRPIARVETVAVTEAFDRLAAAPVRSARQTWTYCQERLCLHEARLGMRQRDFMRQAA